ncbi:hypothetical protein [Aurantiacibacter sediminis]|uniref:Uncharacterized protein n=1 Tax=Aurantiacibacter sediminis TaxID=2793064 RepID=A0ABS0MZE8_9SPHN|nr:hypothetical protein [Aurantiacibacter sediminis]MBH5321081.1 hypothetical protein [Aurantiacibacter sediminis]
MTDIAAIQADPHWLPHTLDLAGKRMRFVRISKDALTQSGFLADLQPQGDEDAQWLPLNSVRSMQVKTGPLHFIFHTAFCRSTLLARAMNIPGVSVGMAEPGILAQLAGAGDAAKNLVKPVCDLLSRPWSRAEAVFVKPTNHANMLIPALLEARPDAKAVLMTNPLPTFLRSVDKRALMGRRWGRQLYLEVMGYAGMDLGMDAREQFSMTDLQAAGLAWFLSQRMYAMLQASSQGPRLRVLDGDRFALDRADTVEAVLELAGLPYDPREVETVVDGPIFRKHAKLGGEFDEKASAASPALEQEIGQVQQWLGMIAEQAGAPIPARHNLF